MWLMQACLRFLPDCISSPSSESSSPNISLIEPFILPSLRRIVSDNAHISVTENLPHAKRIAYLPPVPFRDFADCDSLI